MYMCYIHNLVNARLDKPIFDCSSGLEGIYDCGCAEDEADAKGGTGNVNGEVVEDGEGGKRDPLTGEEMMGG
jgi:FAD-linked sulfhydryl oxidase